MAKKKKAITIKSLKSALESSSPLLGLIPEMGVRGQGGYVTRSLISINENKGTNIRTCGSRGVVTSAGAFPPAGVSQGFEQCGDGVSPTRKDVHGALVRGKN